MPKGQARYRAFALKDVLDFFAERDGDVDARIALRAKDLSSPWSYLQLAQFCLSREEAFRRAEEGLWVFEDVRPDERLVVFTAGLLTKAGRSDDAESVLWRAFGKSPSLELYIQLVAVGGEVARERAIELLQTQLVKQPSTQWRQSPRPSITSPATRARTPTPSAGRCRGGAS